MEEQAPTRFNQFDEKEKAEFWHSLSLRHTAGIGVKTLRKLLAHYGSATIAVKNPDEWENIKISRQKILAYKKGSWKKGADTEYKLSEKFNPVIILWINKLFPPQLKEIIDAPIFLYAKGNADLLAYPAIAIVGSRYASEESKKNATKLAELLSAAGLVITSGMAMGIDACAHMGALSSIGKSIGVLGTGINIIYPWINKGIFENMSENGLLLSEFAPSTPPHAKNFPIRNRIISGLSLGVIVVEAAESSGSLITASIALEQNREVFAIPGKPFNKQSKGCQNLVRSGAHPVFEVDDVLIHLKASLNNFREWKQFTRREVPSSSKTPDKNFKLQNELPGCDKNNPFEGQETVKQLMEGDLTQNVIKCLSEHGKLQVDKIGQLLNVDSATLSPVLVSMEMMGQIERLPGAFYELL